MRIILIVVFTIFPIFAHGQFGYQGYDNSYFEFSTLLYAFLEVPTDKDSNERIYRDLDGLQDDMEKAHVDSEDRYKLNSLIADVKVVKEFIAPISIGYTSHLKENQLLRLQKIFGENFTQTKIKVKCPKDEIEFIEISISSLKMCYFHNISKKARNGLRIKYFAVSGNTSSRGEFGAFNGEYTLILNNVRGRYLKVVSAKVTERF